MVTDLIDGWMTPAECARRPVQRSFGTPKVFAADLVAVTVMSIAVSAGAQLAGPQERPAATARADVPSRKVRMRDGASPRLSAPATVAGRDNGIAALGPRSPYPARSGLVAEGALADLFLVKGDPRANIGPVAKPQQSLAAIFKHGVTCDKE